MHRLFIIYAQGVPRGETPVTTLQEGSSQLSAFFCMGKARSYVGLLGLCNLHKICSLTHIQYPPWNPDWDFKIFRHKKTLYKTGMYHIETIVQL